MITDKKFGDASTRVVVEQFLKGIELSVFVLTDGKNYITLPEAKDYKRIGEKDSWFAPCIIERRQLVDFRKIYKIYCSGFK